MSGQSQYGIKASYKSRNKPKYFSDELESTITWQPDVYRLALTLAERTGAKYIVDIGSGNGKKLEPFINKFKIIAIDFGDNLALAKKLVGKKHEFINQDLEKGLPSIDSDVLKESIVICADVIEHIIKPDKLIRGLRDVALHAPYVLLSTPDRTRTYGINNFGPPPNEAHVREWNLEELSTYLHTESFRAFTAGYTFSNDLEFNKSTILILSGTHSTPASSGNRVRCIAVMYSSIQKARPFIGFYYDNHCDVLVVDKAKRMAYYHCYDDPSKNYVIKNLSHKHIQKALRLLNISACWLIECKAGQQIQSIFDYRLREAISWVDDLGYSSIIATELKKYSDDLAHIHAAYEIASSNTQISKYPESPINSTFPLNFVSTQEPGYIHRIIQLMKSGKAGPAPSRGYIQPYVKEFYFVEIILGKSYKYND